jgi:hypothetical protein
MTRLAIAAFAVVLTCAAGSFIDAAAAPAHAWYPQFGCVEPGAYSYDGYQPAPIYYRPYYGTMPICRHRTYRVHVHVVHARG